MVTVYGKMNPRDDLMNYLMNLERVSC